jgi:hypothetical protein
LSVLAGLATFWIDSMAKKKAKPKATRKPGGGRKSSYGEPTVPFSSRLPESVVEIAKFVGGGNATQGIVEIVRQSVQYRLEHGSGEPEFVE